MLKLFDVLGNKQRLDGGSMFGNAPRAVWERWHQPDTQGRVELNCRCLLVQTDEQNILLETGIGAFFPPKLANRFGVEQPEVHILLENLQKIGLDHTDIDVVLLSHLHFDHAGGMLTAFDPNQPARLLFPNAQYITGQKAWERALNPHLRDRASFIPELNSLLDKSGRLHLVDGSEQSDLLPKSFSFLESNGHTPGQLHTLIRGSEHNLLFCGDLIPGLSWMHVPITMGYDRFPEQLIDEKSKILAQAEAENWWLFFTHDPSLAAVRCETDSKGRFVVKEQMPQLEGYCL